LGNGSRSASSACAFAAFAHSRMVSRVVSAMLHLRHRVFFHRPPLPAVLLQPWPFDAVRTSSGRPGGTDRSHPDIDLRAHEAADEVSAAAGGPVSDAGAIQRT